MVLKSLPKNYTAVKDFYREFHFSYHLSAHRNIVSTFDVAFQTASFYVFAQEYAPLGDLTSNISDTGIGELHSKSVAKQVVISCWIPKQSVINRSYLQPTAYVQNYLYTAVINNY